MSSAKTKLIATFLSLAVVPPLVRAEDSSQAEEAQLDEMDRRIREIRKQVQQMREEQQRRELAAPLAEKSLMQVTDGDYAGAAASLDAWELADPSDPRVGPLRTLVRQMAQEWDERRRTELLREYLDVMTEP